MDLFLALCQALGLGLAFGIGGPLAALFASVMASIQAGIDPRGTDWSFFGEAWFVAVLFVCNVLAFLGARGPDGPARMRLPLVVFAAAIGAIAGAASLAEEGETAILGAVVGAAAGAASAQVAGSALAGARGRASRAADGEAQAAADVEQTLALLFAGAGIAIAAMALFLPPTSLLVLAGLVVLALGQRRRAGEKYEGLRVLR